MRVVLPFIFFATMAQGQTIPDLPSLIKEVRAHQQKTEELRENYTFHQSQQVEALDAHGKVESTTTEEREVFFVHRHRISRLLKKNGKELTEAERKSEDQRVNKRVAEVLKSGEKQRSAQNSPTMSQILSMAKISAPRQLLHNGRKTLVFDFTGDPSAHSKGMEEGMAKKMSGTIWIDETEHQTARIEVKFDDNFRMAGGLLASIQKGTSMEMEQAPLGEGLWMQTSSDIHVGARLLVKNFRQNVHTRNVEFRKFDVGTFQQIQPLKR